MSIKSRTPGIASDVPLKSKQRAPTYLQHNEKTPKVPMKQINNISNHVSQNLAQIPKPRHGENR